MNKKQPPSSPRVREEQVVVSASPQVSREAAKIKVRVCLEPAQEGGYFAFCPEIPGCTSYGNTREEALETIKEAIAEYLDPLEGNDRDIPSSCEIVFLTFTAE